MSSIIYIGIDTHKNSYTLCAIEPKKEKSVFKATINANLESLLEFNRSLKENYPVGTEFIYGYEAGCLGYSLYFQLRDYAITCRIIAPTTVQNFGNKKVKTDRRDSENIAKTMAFGLGKYVNIPSEKDMEIREYIRLRDAHKKQLKKLKQQISSFLLRQGIKYTEGKNYWTIKYLNWIKNLEMPELLREILDEYLRTYDYLIDKLTFLDNKIELIAQDKSYKSKVDKLKCIKGIETYTALTLLVEIGDFSRFKKPRQLASYIGLVPSEFSSGDKNNRFGITKTGNNLVRKILTESSQCHARGNPSIKSARIKRKQKGCTRDVIEEADKINERLGKRFNYLLHRGLPWNKVVTAVSRELICDIWYMMNKID